MNAELEHDRLLMIARTSCLDPRLLEELRDHTWLSQWDEAQETFDKTAADLDIALHGLVPRIMSKPRRSSVLRLRRRIAKRLNLTAAGVFLLQQTDADLHSDTCRIAHAYEEALRRSELISEGAESAYSQGVLREGQMMICVLAGSDMIQSIQIASPEFATRLRAGIPGRPTKLRRFERTALYYLTRPLMTTAPLGSFSVLQPVALADHTGIQSVCQFTQVAVTNRSVVLNVLLLLQEINQNSTHMNIRVNSPIDVDGDQFVVARNHAHNNEIGGYVDLKIIELPHDIESNDVSACISLELGLCSLDLRLEHWDDLDFYSARKASLMRKSLGDINDPDSGIHTLSEMAAVESDFREGFDRSTVIERFNILSAQLESKAGHVGLVPRGSLNRPFFEFSVSSEVHEVGHDTHSSLEAIHHQIQDSLEVDPLHAWLVELVRDFCARYSSEDIAADRLVALATSRLDPFLSASVAPRTWGQRTPSRRWRESVPVSITCRRLSELVVVEDFGVGSVGPVARWTDLPGDQQCLSQPSVSEYFRRKWPNRVVMTFSAGSDYTSIQRHPSVGSARLRIPGDWCAYDDSVDLRDLRVTLNKYRQMLEISDISGNPVQLVNIGVMPATSADIVTRILNALSCGLRVSGEFRSSRSVPNNDDEWESIVEGAVVWRRRGARHAVPDYLYTADPYAWSGLTTWRSWLGQIAENRSPIVVDVSAGRRHDHNSRSLVLDLFAPMTIRVLAATISSKLSPVYLTVYPETTQELLSRRTDLLVLA